MSNLSFSALALFSLCMLLPFPHPAQADFKIEEPASSVTLPPEEKITKADQIASDMQAKIQGKERMSPQGQKTGADTYLYFTQKGTDAGGTRIYGGTHRITQKTAGSAIFSVVESEDASSGEKRSTLSLLSPDGVMLNIFDGVNVTMEHSSTEDSRVMYRWSEEQSAPSGEKYTCRYEALAGRNSLSLREREGAENSFEWSDLRSVKAIFTGGKTADNISSVLHFQTADGEKLELLSFGKNWLSWLEKNGTAPLYITCGTCRFDLSMESGSGIFLFDALPVPEKEPSPAAVRSGTKRLDVGGRSIAVEE